MFETLAQIRKLLNLQDGQALAEYALILGFIALTAAVALGVLGGAITGPFLDFVSEAGFGSSSS